jgi:hypothetical protein
LVNELERRGLEGGDLAVRHHGSVKVQIARDWVDYVQAVGVLVSLVLAGGALIYAKKSSTAAAESAEAAATTAAAATQEAEQTRELLRLASDQHQRLVREASRRPVLATPVLLFRASIDPDQLTLGQIMSMGALALSDPVGEEVRLWPVVVKAVFENVGDKPADQTLARVSVPVEVGLWRAGPDGEHPQDVDLHDEDVNLSVPSGDSRAHAHSWRIQHLPPAQPEALHLLLVFRDPGDHEVELQAEHEEAEPVGQRFVIRVPEAGPAGVQRA